MLRPLEMDSSEFQFLLQSTREMACISRAECSDARTAIAQTKEAIAASEAILRRSDHLVSGTIIATHEIESLE